MELDARQAGVAQRHAWLPDDARLRSTLKDWFRWAAEAMAAYPDTPDDVPGDLALPHWSWIGPVHES